MVIATNDGPSIEYSPHSVHQQSLTLSQAPVLSTPDYDNFTTLSYQHEKTLKATSSVEEIDEFICQKYEIKQTAEKLQEGGWKRVALQFPDNMVDDAWIVVSNLKKALEQYETIYNEVDITKKNDGSKNEISVTQESKEIRLLLSV